MKTERKGSTPAALNLVNASSSMGDLMESVGKICGDCPKLRDVLSKLDEMDMLTTDRERRLRLTVAEQVLDGLIAMRNIPASRRLR